jgi:hypothetical protein
LRLGAEVEVWNQDVYGVGAAAAAEVNVQLVGGFGLTGWAGYKDKGYSLGRPIEATPFGALGMTYRFDHGARGGR